MLALSVTQQGGFLPLGGFILQKSNGMGLIPAPKPERGRRARAHTREILAPWQAVPGKVLEPAAALCPLPHVVLGPPCALMPMEEVKEMRKVK